MVAFPYIPPLYEYEKRLPHKNAAPATTRCVYLKNMSSFFRLVSAKERISAPGNI
jgi:hypothetical protein